MSLLIYKTTFIGVSGIQISVEARTIHSLLSYESLQSLYVIQTFSTSGFRCFWWNEFVPCSRADFHGKWNGSKQQILTKKHYNSVFHRIYKLISAPTILYDFSSSVRRETPVTLNRAKSIEAIPISKSSLTHWHSVLLFSHKLGVVMCWCNGGRACLCIKSILNSHSVLASSSM